MNSSQIIIFFQEVNPAYTDYWTYNDLLCWAQATYNDPESAAAIVDDWVKQKQANGFPKLNLQAKKKTATPSLKEIQYNLIE